MRDRYTLRINEDGQFEIVHASPFGEVVTVIPRAESREKAEALIVKQGAK